MSETCPAALLNASSILLAGVTQLWPRCFALEPRCLSEDDWEWSRDGRSRGCRLEWTRPKSDLSAGRDSHVTGCAGQRATTPSRWSAGHASVQPRLTMVRFSYALPGPRRRSRALQERCRTQPSSAHDTAGRAVLGQAAAKLSRAPFACASLTSSVSLAVTKPTGSGAGLDQSSCSIETIIPAPPKSRCLASAERHSYNATRHKSNYLLHLLPAAAVFALSPALLHLLASSAKTLPSVPSTACRLVSSTILGCACSH